MTKLEKMYQQHHDGNSSMSFLVGFIMALGNHLFGWMNQIQPTSHIPSYVQALLMGIFGAIGTYFGNQIIKFFKKVLKKNQEHEPK